MMFRLWFFTPRYKTLFYNGSDSAYKVISAYDCGGCHWNTSEYRVILQQLFKIIKMYGGYCWKLLDSNLYFSKF
jgi:hypothetical protein